MLVITKEQKAVFTQALLLRRIRKYLLKNIPEIHKNIPEEKFDIFTKKSLGQAEYFGIRNEQSLAKWTYLNAITNGRLIKAPGVREYMEQTSLSPDVKVDKLMRSLAVAAKLHEVSILGMVG